MWLRKTCTSSTSSGLSSCSSSEVSSHRTHFHSDSGMDLSSIAEQVFEDLSISETNTSDTDTVECISSHRHSNNHGDLTVNFTVSSPEDESLYELFGQILDWLDPKSSLFNTVTGRPSRHIQEKQSTNQVPSMAVVVFLHEEEQSGHFQLAQNYLTSRPWKFHHQEWVAGQMQVYPNSHHYYMLTLDRPLCSVRQIHCGKQHIRIMRYVSNKHWKDTISFYKLILGRDAIALKRDFCLFTLGHYPNYDLQFALKRLQRGMQPKRTRKAQLCFHVCDIGSLVPLFPNECHKVSDVRWCTKDLDGNRIYLEVPKLPRRSRSVSPSKFHAHSKHSAFSPVVPNKVKLNEGCDSLLDKLSPRVYKLQDSSLVNGRPPLPNKIYSSIKALRPQTYMQNNVIRTRPASANSVPSDGVTNIRACPQASTPIKSVTNLRTRPSSANSVLISSTSDTVCSHSYTDSGFVDSSMDSSYTRDPRRTPIVGISNLTQYERFISTPNGEVPLSPNSYREVPSSSSYDDMQSPNSPDESFSFMSFNNDTVFALERDIPHHKCKHEHHNSLPKEYSMRSNKSWVECYVEDQNKLLREKSPVLTSDLQKSGNYNPSHINGIESSPNYTTIENPKLNLNSAKESHLVDGIIETVHENYTEMGIECGSMDMNKSDQVVPTVADINVQQDELKIPLHDTDNKQSSLLNENQINIMADSMDKELTSRSVAVDAEKHNLQEYMHLCWANSGNRSQSNSPINNVSGGSNKEVSEESSSSVYIANHNSGESLNEITNSNTQDSNKLAEVTVPSKQIVNTNIFDWNATDINHTEKEQTNDLTLAEFLNTNKKVSDFLDRQGNKVVHLPDVVRINNCDNSQTVIEKHDSVNIDNREGCPDDILNSNRTIKSCLHSQSRGNRKRVTFSEINSLHEYEGMDWSEDIIDAYTKHDTENGNMNDFINENKCINHNLSESSSLTIATKVPIMNGQKTAKVASIIDKFNNPESSYVTPNVMKSVPTSHDVKSVVNKDNSIKSKHNYTTEDWVKIKQKPQVGFYI